jgi:type VI secretion system protein ImpJ
MYLGPHHFQAQGRYFEDSIQFAAAALWSHPYGFIGYGLDAEALTNGTVSIVHARGILPDGLPFHMPEHDSPPPARPIEGLFPPTREGILVYLAIPQRRLDGMNCASEDTADVRFVAEMRPLVDETTGRDERDIRIARKNLRLLLDTEPMDGLAAMPIARVIRDGAGHYIYDAEFVPPCLQISASERLMLIVRRLIEILQEKSSSLARTASAKGEGEYSAGEIANFWLLHSVNSSHAALRHLWMVKRGHPEDLFIELSRLAGALCTFSLDSHPQTLPSYDHDSPQRCFDELDRHIRMHLEITVPTNCLAIKLTRVADYFYEGDVTDTRCFGRSRWVLGVRSAVGEADLITRVPQLVKICSAKFIAELVKRAVAGLPLLHLPMPPPAVPTRLEMQYFSISKSGPFWDNVVQTARVGIYVPGDLPDPELELLVVIES